MNNAFWRLADLASQALEPHERDAVRGDLIEAHADGGRALAQVLGLVARRQAALWADWRPWVAVLTIVVPIGVLLSHAARWWAVRNGFNFSLYLRLWDWSYLDYPGWRHELLLVVWYGISTGVTLAGWSWASGYVLASLSRRTVWTTTAIFALIVLLGTLGTPPIGRTNNGTLADHMLPVVLPRLVRLGLVLLPALWGMVSFQRRSYSRSTLLTGAVALLLLTLLSAQFLEASLTLGRGVYPSASVVGPDLTAGTADDLRPLWPISLVMVWPTVVVLLSSLRRAPVTS